MKPLIVANWKCNPASLKQAKQLFDSVKRGLKNFKKAEAAICPPFVYLSSLALGKRGLAFGAQNCFWEESGAFTGEISPLMLKDSGVEYVILGHSERRRIFNETDEQIHKKIKVALAAGLKPIFCVGETKEEKDQEKKEQVLKQQIEQGLKNIASKEIKKIVIAYEPVWAIGTGHNCSVEETTKSVLIIRRTLVDLFSQEAARNLPILYGGSVNSQNARRYIKEANCQGLLVGGASLKAEEFVKIVKSVV